MLICEAFLALEEPREEVWVWVWFGSCWGDSPEIDRNYIDWSNSLHEVMSNLYPKIPEVGWEFCNWPYLGRYRPLSSKSKQNAQKDLLLKRQNLAVREFGLAC